MMEKLIEHYERQACAEIAAISSGAIMPTTEQLMDIQRRLIDRTAPVYAEMARLKGLETRVTIELPKH